MSAGHNHSHSHAHSQSNGGLGSRERKRLAFAFAIAGGVVLAQATGSILTGSLALLTDTAHAAVDASGLFVALLAARLAAKPASDRHTWGYRRIEVLAALAQSTLLMAVGIYTAIESVERFFSPAEIPSSELLFFGALGLLANFAAIIVLVGARKSNFNMRAAFLEVLNDALGSVGVIVAALVISTTGFMQADSIAGVFIAILIVPRAFTLMKDTTAVLMEFTPEGLDLERVREHIRALPHVKDVHDVHATTVATGLPTLSAHIIVEDECFHDGHAADMLIAVRECVAKHFDVSIQHSTFQIETMSVSESEEEGQHSHM